MTFELVSESAGITANHALGMRPVYIGRAPTNDIVLLDDTVSGRHAAVWADARGVLVEDLKSRNGTFLNDRLIDGVTIARSGDVLRFGSSRVLRVRQQEAGDVRKHFVLVDLQSDQAMHLMGDRFIIGAGGDFAVDGERTVLQVQEDEVWRGVGDDLYPVAVGEPFEASGRQFELRTAEVQGLNPTVDAKSTRYPYVLEAALNGPGPRASFIDRASDARHVVRSANRATLLYLLGRKVARDREAGVLDAERGWIESSAAAIGVWGKAAASEEKLNVLLCRVRKELREAGFDPWCIERRNQHLRIRVLEARVA